MYVPSDKAKLDAIIAAATEAGVEITDDVFNAAEAIALSNNGRLTGYAPKGVRPLIDAGVLVESGGSARTTTITIAA